MRYLIGLWLILSLTSCTTGGANYYTPTVESWRNGNVSDLVKRWGTPDTKIVSANGNVLYLYRTESYRTYGNQASPSIGVNYKPGGRPVLITQPSINSPDSRGNLAITCVAAFEANKQGKIIHTQIQGSGCYGGENFANTKQNPMTGNSR